MSRSKPHVALCTDGVFPHALGGMQRHSRLLAEHLARTGELKVTVIHPHAAQVFDPALGITEVCIADIDTRRTYLRELWRYSGRVGAELERIAPDVVLAQGFSVWKGMGRFRGRLIVHPHGLEMFQGITAKERILGAPFRMVLRYIVRRASVVISLGGKITGLLQRVASGSGCRVEVIPNAVELPEVQAAYPLEGTPLRLLFVGRFAFNKGLDVLLDVARRLVQEGRAADVRFELAGDGPLLADMNREGLPANVVLLGRVDDAQLAQLYAECHALVLPTRFEGMPTVVLEAMARCKPIFVSDVGASAELVNMHNGYLLPPGNADALYNAVVDFLARSADVRVKMGVYSHQRVTELFTWPVIVQRFVVLFAGVAVSRGG